MKRLFRTLFYRREPPEAQEPHARLWDAMGAEKIAEVTYRSSRSLPGPKEDIANLEISEYHVGRAERCLQNCCFVVWRGIGCWNYSCC